MLVYFAFASMETTQKFHLLTKTQDGSRVKHMSIGFTVSRSSRKKKPGDHKTASLILPRSVH
jgi:phage head maturation protease